MEKLLLNAIEAVEAMGVGRTRICELLVTGQLPSVRIGRSIRVLMDALRRWIQEIEVVGGDAEHSLKNLSKIRGPPQWHVYPEVSIQKTTPHY